ncbi:TetR/AcrR family transcriptional regulator [soil metagenome]
MISPVTERPADHARPPVRQRMRGDDRRRQLLDAAAEVIVEHGAAAMSMERLAVVAGVSKALPYKHFDNAEAVLAALYRRETTALGRAVWRALSHAAGGEDLVRVGIRAYFDEVSRRGAVLAALSAPGSTIASVADPTQAGVIFEVEVFDRFHGLDRDRAKAVAGMVQGAVVGATGTWLVGHGTRQELEDDLVAMITTLIGRPNS